MANREKVETVADFILGGGGGAPKSMGMVTAAMILKDAPWKESNDKPRQHIKKQRCHFADKSLYSESYGFSRSQVWM